MVMSVSMGVALMVIMVIGLAVVVPIMNSVADENENSTVSSIMFLLPGFVLILFVMMVIGLFISPGEQEDEADESTNRYEQMNPKKMIDWMRENFRW
jgi:RsiW-degrading membrane proteinase PrsW (M82 family)